MNPYTQDLLGRHHRADLDREADRARLVEIARAVRPASASPTLRDRLASLWPSTGREGLPAGSPHGAARPAQSQIGALVAELRRTRERLAEVERSLEALAGE